MHLRNILTTICLLGVFVLAGCLVSGTFILWESITLNAVSATFYRGSVNLEDNEDWQDHNEDIDRVETVGFEVWMTNNSSNEIILNGYIDDPRTPLYDEGEVVANTFQIIDSLPVPGNTSNERIVTYVESFDYIDNVADLKRLVKSGMFDYYGILSGTGVSGAIDSIKVVVTLNASDT